MSVLKIIGIVVCVSILLFVAVAPGTSLQFRAVLELVFNFVAVIAWPLAAVLIVLVLRNPLSELIKMMGQRRGGD